MPKETWRVFCSDSGLRRVGWMVLMVMVQATVGTTVGGTREGRCFAFAKLKG